MFPLCPSALSLLLKERLVRTEAPLYLFSRFYLTPSMCDIGGSGGDAGGNGAEGMRRGREGMGSFTIAIKERFLD